MAVDTRKTEVVTTVNGQQARAELKMLEDAAKHYKMEMVEANEAGDIKRFDNAKKAFQATNKEIKQVTKSLFDVNTVLNNLSTAKPKELQSALSALNKQLNSPDVERGGKKWNEINASMEKIRDEQAKINAESKAGQSMWSRMADGMNKYAAMGATVIATISGITFAISELKQERDKQEESAANLKALTGLGDEDIAKLKGDAKGLATTTQEGGIIIRQSTAEILDAYTKVGSAKPELLKNADALNEVTKQTMILSAASKNDLQSSVEAVTLALNMYGEGADQASRYVNVLAAGSKEGAAEVPSITEAIHKSGVSAAKAKVPIEQLVGSIEALADKGIKDEIAGTGLKTFFLKLETGAKDTRPSIVGLDKALENLKKKHLDAAAMKEMFGLETYNVAATMIDNADKVKYYTQAVTGTSTAMEQAAINSNTTAARMAQTKNKMVEAGVALVEKFNPAIITGQTLITKMIQGLAALIPYFGTIEKLLVMAAGYYVSMNAKMIVNNILLKEGIGLKIKDAVVMQALILKEELAAVTTGKMTLASKAAAIAQTIWNNTIKANPLGAIAAAITTVIGLIWLFSKREEEVAQSQQAKFNIQKKINEQYGEQENKVKSLVSILNNEKLSLEARKKALLDLKQIVPNYHADLSEEGKLINDNKEAINQYLVQLEKKIKMEAYQDELGRLFKSKVTTERLSRATFRAQLSPEDKATYDQQKQMTGAFSSNEAMYRKWLNQQKGYVDTVNSIKEISKNLSEVSVGSILDNNKGGGDGGGDDKPDPTDKKGLESKKKAIDKQLELVDEWKLEEEAKLKQAYLDQKMNKIAFDQQMEDLELRALYRRLEIAGLEPKKIKEIQDKILDYKIKFMNSVGKIESRDGKKISADTIAIAKNTGDKLKSIGEKSLVDEQRKIEEKKRLQDQYIGIGQSAVKSFADITASYMLDSTESAAQFQYNMIMMALDSLEQVVQLAIASAIATEIGSKGLLGIATGAIASAAVQVAFAGVKSLVHKPATTTDGYESGGYMDVTRAQDGKRFNAVYDPTKRGYVDRPTVIVGEGRRSKEWIASNGAVENPTVAPFINALDIAQKNGTISTFDMNKYFANHFSGYSGGGFISLGGSPAGQSPAGGAIYSGGNDNMEIMIAMLMENQAKLMDKLDQPLTAQAVISGDKGVANQLDRYNTLINNASR